MYRCVIASEGFDACYLEHDPSWQLQAAGYKCMCPLTADQVYTVDAEEDSFLQRT